MAERDAAAHADRQVLLDFQEQLANPDIAVPVAAIRSLAGVANRSKATTLYEISLELKAAAELLKREYRKTSISLTAGCDLFVRFSTRTLAECSDFRDALRSLRERGSHFAAMSMRCRATIADLSQEFIRDGATILTHGYSRVVMEILRRAARTRRFSLIVTEGRPDGAGVRTASALSAAGIPVTVILDSAMGFVMERVDVVLVGAESVVESGGVVNKIGTNQLAVVAKAMNKPFYVAAESYKFARLFPLNQRDLPESKEEQEPLQPSAGELPPGVLGENPSADYTPAKYITMLLTDLGVLTPSAVSDELIKLYQ